MTTFSDLRKRAEEIEAASVADRKAMAMLLRDLIARLDDADKSRREHLRIQEERRLGLRP
jgi:hypothetical protein